MKESAAATSKLLEGKISDLQIRLISQEFRAEKFAEDSSAISRSTGLPSFKVTEMVF